MEKLASQLATAISAESGREFDVYYSCEPSFQFNSTIEIDDLPSKYKKVLRVKVDEEGDVFAKLEALYYLMQTPIWSPNGEAAPLIRGLGLWHVGISVGDLVHDIETNSWFQVGMFRFVQMWV